ncbi:hemolysin family protein [Aquabacterium sp. A7-Y]|uniref:hemolysin family protein n=1 Tax=Aquabacterium sp. A7-Y TaxID=1349605 RepID=UPI00223CFF89|nr:hemolysin family protein [Aquabacterium sp. A7-Y]MCW7540626.1 hemolysin family protein [Aquabacterium sp. A7-Y]
MGLTSSLIVIALLIGTSAYFSIAEISLAAARRLRLRQMADEGEARAQRVIEIQEQPGNYFTVVQIGLNAVAILGGIVGEGTLTPHLESLLLHVTDADTAHTAGFLLSFLIVTSLFILFADLFPKRVGMTQPEQVAIRVVTPMLWWAALLKPVVWVFNSLANVLFKLLGLPAKRDDRITHDDILALTEAGAQAGLLLAQEQQVIANVFELDVRTVESSMTSRERIVYFLVDDPEEEIRARIAAEPHSTYLVCNTTIDEVVGYVDAADLFQRVLKGEPISLQGEAAEGLLHKVLMVPDRITLSEMLGQFRQAHEDFAVIVNEYSLVVGVITLNDVMSTVMGSLVSPHDEDQIVRREDGSWLIDGVTPIVDVMRAIDLDELPHQGQYDTLAGFLMVMLRRIPRRTDSVSWGGYKFEVMDVDSYRIDQVMVTRLPAAAA